jgi:preprotein translocase SecE subunit
MEQVRSFYKFLQDVVREIHPKKGRVTWPTMKQIRLSTLVVVLSSIMMSIYITFCDAILRFVLLRS